MTVIELQGLSFGYGGEKVLSDISVTIDKPELVCLLGPNGVGKTTLVKCINKLLKPTSGRVLLDGKDVASMSLPEVACEMAYVPNTVSNVFSMTVAEAVLMGRHPHAGWTTSAEDLDIVEDALRAMSLEDMSDRDIRELSQGQLQRAMIARGMVQESRVLILDEPTSNLDVRYQMEVMGLLRQYARENGVIVLMVCHDLNITAAYADRVLLMSGGRIYADGSVDEVLTEDNIRAVYGVDAKVMDIDGVKHVAMLPSGSEEKSAPSMRIRRQEKADGPEEKKSRRKPDGRAALAALIAFVLIASAAAILLPGGDDGERSGPGSIVGSTVAESDFPDSSSRLWVYGNADEDDHIDAFDVDYIRGILDGTNRMTTLADANGDGRVDEADIEYLERILASEEVDVYYIDNYYVNSKVSWPVSTIAIGYCSGAYVADVTGLCGKVVMVDSTIKSYWHGMNPAFESAGSFGETETPDYEAIMKAGVDVYIPGYPDVNADKLSKAKLGPAGIDVMMVSTSDNSSVDYPNEHIDRSILMLGYLLQGDLAKTYEYLEWHDGIMAKLVSAAATLSEDEKQSFMMARSSPAYSEGTYSITGKDNTNNIHAEWAGVHAVGQTNKALSKNYNSLTAEQILSVIREEARGNTLFYMDNEHDGMRHQRDLDECVRADAQMLKDSGVDIHYLGMAREAGNSPLYIVEMVFYQNVMYPDLDTGLDYRELFAEYFSKFASYDYTDLVDIDDFFKDYGVL